MDFEKEIVILKPIKKIEFWKKRKKEFQTFYITANDIYSERIHFSQKIKIQNMIKEYLIPYFSDIPKLEKMTMDITYFDNSTIWDIDNKDYVWRKIILDLFKIPTSKQILKAEKYKNEIITLNILPEDNVKHYLGGSHYYGGRGSKMIILIKGRLLNEQKQLF